MCAKFSFYAAVNGLLGKFLNLASEEVILELVRTKCTPIFTVRHYASAVYAMGLCLSVCVCHKSVFY